MPGACARAGGASASTLKNRALSSNRVVQGGGAVRGTFYKRIVYFNTALQAANYGYGTLNYSCTRPTPADGVGNITNAPLFMDYAGGNLGLGLNSPCINAGNNAYVTVATDLDGNPRIVSGTADFAHADADGLNNWQEWVCGTCPTNPLSVLCLLSATTAGTNVAVTWQSTAGVSYFLDRSTNLGAPFTLLATGIPGQAGTTIFTDTNTSGAGPFFYRVGVNCP